jgi:hypothetical protein
MAVTSTIEYTTHRTIKDIYPGIDSYDTKQRIYNFVSLGNNIYVAHNVGLVTQLFTDGKELNPVSQAATEAAVHYKTSLTVNLESVPDTDVSKYNLINYNAGAFTTGSESDIQLGDYIYLDTPGGSTNEYAFIEAINTGANQITVRRAALGSTAYSWTTGNSATFNDYIRLDNIAQWHYDSYFDQVLLYSTSSPNDLIIESGEDASTLMTRMIRRSSRMVESMLDSRMAREIVKDREGNYPEFIQRAAGLKAIVMLLQAKDPENPIVDSFNEEFNEIIEGYRSGNIQLTNAVTADSGKGMIREVSVNSSSDLRPVELKGTYSGSGYDLIQIKIITGGVVGTATYSVWVKDNDLLKTHQVITAETITGDYDLVANSIYVRFSGDDIATAIVTADDEWEIPVWGANCETTVSQSGSISLTRR